MSIAICAQCKRMHYPEQSVRRGVPSFRLRQEAEKRRTAQAETEALRMLVETLERIQRQPAKSLRLPGKAELVKWRAAYDALTELGITI